MFKFFCALFSAVAIFSTAFARIVFAQAVQAGDISVKIIGVDSSGGDIRIALVSDNASLKSEDLEPVAKAQVPASGDSINYTFKNVPFGTYAVKAFHDSNQNGQLDKGAFGIPKEQYGFSQVPASKKGMPKFDSAEFKHEKPSTLVNIELK